VEGGDFLTARYRSKAISCLLLLSVLAERWQSACTSVVRAGWSRVGIGACSVT
jgi:hypothetical protein